MFIFNFLAVAIIMVSSASAALVMQITHDATYGITFAGFRGSTQVVGTPQDNHIVFTNSYGGSVDSSKDAVDLEGGSIFHALSSYLNSPVVNYFDASEGLMTNSSATSLRITDSGLSDSFYLYSDNFATLGLNDTITWSGYTALNLSTYGHSWTDFKQGQYDLSLVNGAGFEIPAQLIIGSVPEPSSIAFFIISLLGIMSHRVRQ